MYIEVKIREHLYKAVVLPHVRGGGDNWIIILLLIMEKTVRTLDNIRTLAHCYCWGYIESVQLLCAKLTVRDSETQKLYIYAYFGLILQNLMEVRLKVDHVSMVSKYQVCCTVILSMILELVSGPA